MDHKPGFFDFAAEVGLTKHIGGLEATDSLIDLCQINRSSYVLDVGCGVGATPCYLAQKIGCHVIGVDILEKMVERSRERALRENVEKLAEFRVADAQNLPFEAGLFDAVITESVTAFPEDKQKAVNEYVRVTKPGGYVGLNESTWLKAPPPPEMVAWAEQEVGASVQPLTQERWRMLLETAGLQIITVRTFPVALRIEAKGILNRYGWAGMFGVLSRMLRLYARNPDYRVFVKRIRQGGVVPDHLEDYFGYGLFIGRK